MSGNLFLNAPFPDLCLLVPFRIRSIFKSVDNNPCFFFVFVRVCAWGGGGVAESDTNGN